MEGFGSKSFENLLESLKKASHTTLAKVIFSLGIPNIGLANAKMICRHFQDDIDQILHADREELEAIDGVGGVIAQSLIDYFAEEKNREQLKHLMKHLQIEKEEIAGESSIKGMNFVITGSLSYYENRGKLKELIESLGGKVTGTVTKKTNYLINNDTASGSSKNKKARELGIPVISEEEFRSMIS